MAKANPCRFSTKVQDDETDLLYYGYRYYSASTGRWLSRDPIAEKGGFNLYDYVSNRPINDLDPLGQVPLWLEVLFKKAGFEFWKTFLIRANHWKTLVDAWYDETPPQTWTFTGVSDPRNRDISRNVGFVKLLRCSIAAQRGQDISSELDKCSAYTRATVNSFYWHYAYPGASPGAAGGLAAYHAETHFLGSYGGSITLVSGTPGTAGRCRYRIYIKNTSGWTSATRLPGFVASTIAQVSSWLPDWVPASGWSPIALFTDHDRGWDMHYSPYGASRGGNMDEIFDFETEDDCCAKCELP